MHQLLGDRAGLDESFLRELFLQRLPSNVSMVLAATPSTTHLQSLAELADRVTEVAAPPVATVTPSGPLASQPPQATPVSTVGAYQPTSADFERILSELSKLQTTVGSLTWARSRTPSGRSRHRSPTPNPIPSVTDQICWYHQKYGDEARKCNPPCSHPNAQARH